MLSRKKALLQQEKEVLIRLKDAREMGDLSENGAYKYAKFELGNIRRELRKISHLLKVGYIPKVSSPTGVVHFGSTVTLTKESESITFMLVSKHESNPSENRISSDSPIGRAVSGKRVGDIFCVSTPKGNVTYTVSQIR